jgi:hypothetical protein
MATADQIKNNVKGILENYYALKEARLAPRVEPDPYDKEPDKRKIRGFRQKSVDVSGDSTLEARDVGNLTRGKTRLNIVSALTKRDKVDFFKFNATENEKFGISVTTDKNVRIQLLDNKGKVIADSEAKTGDKFDNFKKAGEQALELKKGTYFIKVTRETGGRQDDNPNYAIQLSSTKYYTEDYDTTETPAAKTTYYSSNTYSTAGIGSLLTQFNGGFFDFANGSYYSKKV